MKMDYSALHKLEKAYRSNSKSNLAKLIEEHGVKFSIFLYIILPFIIGLVVAAIFFYSQLLVVFDPTAHATTTELYQVWGTIIFVLILLSSTLLYYTANGEYNEFIKSTVDYEELISSSVKVFAESNGFSYRNEVKKISSSGLLFGLKSYGGMFVGYARDYVFGNFYGFPFEFFRYNFIRTTLSGDHMDESWQTRTVAQVTTKKKFPHLVLISEFQKHKSDKNVLLDRLEEDKLVNIGGEFDKYYRAYCEKGQHIKLLTLLTPDVMEMLMDTNLHADIEFTDHNIIFYWNYDLYTGDNYIAAFRSLNLFFRKLQTKLNRLGSVQQRKLNLVGAHNSLKSGVPSIELYDSKSNSIIASNYSIKAWIKRNKAFLNFYTGLSFSIYITFNIFSLIKAPNTEEVNVDLMYIITLHISALLLILMVVGCCMVPVYYIFKLISSLKKRRATPRFYKDL